MKMLIGPNGRLSTNRLLTLYCFLFLIPAFILACVYWPQLKDLAAWVFGAAGASLVPKTVGDVSGVKGAIDQPPDNPPPGRETLPPIPPDPGDGLGPIPSPPSEGEPPPIVRLPGETAAAGWQTGRDREPVILPPPSPASVLEKYAGIAVMRRDDGRLSFVAGLQVDADGSPRAYHPKGRGLDYLANAGKPGNWWGIATKNGRKDGVPIVQGEGDPAPGFYVSTTSLVRPGFKPGDPRRYIDSETVPYFVLPLDRYKKWGVKLGAEGIVTHLASGVSCKAILADLGPSNHLGEGSIALARALGLPDNPKNGGTSAGIHYLI